MELYSHTSIVKLLTQVLRIFLNSSWLGVDADEIYNIFLLKSIVDISKFSDDNVHD